MAALVSSQRITRSELLNALSYALDLTEGQPQGHGIRCAWIGMHMGREIGLREDELSDLYYTLLLKDIGCSSNAARICNLFLTDDIGFKRGIKTVKDNMPKMVGFILSYTGMKAGLAERFRALVGVFRQSATISHELIDIRCRRGAEIVRRMRFSEKVATGIFDLDEHWNGKGEPAGLKGEAISLYARIALITQVADVFHTSAGPARARRETVRRAGIWFDPALVEVFRTISASADFWTALAAPDLADRLTATFGDDGAYIVDDDYLDDVAAAFADVVDSKSPFTAGHSRRVALFTDMIAEERGLSGDQRRYLKRAALLHDIGKLGVSNQILDKPGKLDEAEFAVVRKHPGLGEHILSQISAFDDLARLAGAHHERLDGQGYPRGLSGDAICPMTRILTTADIFDALTADRPYRAAMPVSKALAIMEQDVGKGIDAGCFTALCRAVAKVEQAAA